MNFNSQHYVPVLKIKRGEKQALRLIASGAQARVTPLLEIVERRPDKAPTVDAHLTTAFKDLAVSVRSYTRCFLDAKEIESDGPIAAAEVFRRASASGIAFTPVTGISRIADVDAALAHRGRGLALRLTRSEFEAGGLSSRVRNFLSKYSLVPEEIDLIVDLGPADDLVGEGLKTLAEAFLRDVPTHARWRTFTVSTCAFPSSMGGVSSRSHAVADRLDWQTWRDESYATRAPTDIQRFRDSASKGGRRLQPTDHAVLCVGSVHASRAVVTHQGGRHEGSLSEHPIPTLGRTACLWPSPVILRRFRPLRRM